MIQFSAMKGFLNDSIGQMNRSTNKLTLTNNQVVQGQVLKLFPDQKALIQIGQSKLVAQLEASLNSLDRYWFRVKGSEQQGLQLKIIRQVNHLTNQSVAKDLLTMFQQKTSKENILLTGELAKDNIPFTKEQLLDAIEILKKTPKRDVSAFVDAAKFAIKQEYPLTENVIKSLMQTQSNVSLANQIGTLFHSLQGLDQPSSIVRQLQQSLLNLIQKSDDLLSVKQFELGGENRLTIKDISNEIQALREMLLVVSKEGEGLAKVKVQIDSLIQRLNGQTLLQQDLGPTTQMITQVPLFPLSNSDLTIQWHGKKQGNGKIDPSFCRILFYLQLPTLKEMMVDVQIQNRVITINITNNFENIKPIISNHSEGLKELLNEMDYKLSAIHVKSFDTAANQAHQKEQVSITNGFGPYTGVDVKI
ncbi:hypothetical protein [Metabacillus halosaccharovorans]|uniref:hypothetical protein n=1 Tax=Metabacillus halosaccharovorans TaxID=930124 RepID=UPI001C1F494B|nr:hypothetical protein [Metabacillus halosaccharovorans]MBU7592099.1 hypothetical protein [Metabacillus halosaccharovorans]